MIIVLRLMILLLLLAMSMSGILAVSAGEQLTEEENVVSEKAQETEQLLYFYGPVSYFYDTNPATISYFDRNRISNDYGGTATMTWTSESGHNVNGHASWTKERFSDAFNSGAGGSLRYQDAWNAAYGYGATFVGGDSGANLSLDYTYTEHHTEEPNLRFFQNPEIFSYGFCR